MQFSLDRKRRSHKQNQCSASDSVGLIFTRSYRFTLLITTPTTTPSLVKTSRWSEKGNLTEVITYRNARKRAAQVSTKTEFLILPYDVTLARLIKMSLYGKIQEKLRFVSCNWRPTN